MSGRNEAGNPNPRPVRPLWMRQEQPGESLSPIGRLRRRLRPLRRHWQQLNYRNYLRCRYYLRGDRSRRRLFILAEGRSGSNLIIDYLRSVPDVATTQEILNDASRIGVRRHSISKAAVLRHIRYSMALPARVAVAKLAMHQMQWHDLTVDDLCRDDPGARFVVLYRRNLALQYISRYWLSRTGQDRARPGDVSRIEPLLLDRDDFADYRRRMRACYEQVAASAALTGRCCVIAYEQLAEAPQRVFDEHVFPLIDLPSSPVSTHMSKQNKRGLAEMIRNYAQVRDLLESPQSFLDLSLPPSPPVDGARRPAPDRLPQMSGARRGVVGAASG